MIFHTIFAVVIWMAIMIGFVFGLEQAVSNHSGGVIAAGALIAAAMMYRNMLVWEFGCRTEAESEPLEPNKAGDEGKD